MLCGFAGGLADAVLFVSQRRTQLFSKIGCVTGFGQPAVGFMVNNVGCSIDTAGDHDAGRLFGVGSRADVQIERGHGDVAFVEEDLRHGVVVMLSRVNEVG